MFCAAARDLQSSYGYGQSKKCGECLPVDLGNGDVVCKFFLICSVEKNCFVLIARWGLLGVGKIRLCIELTIALVVM